MDPLSIATFAVGLSATCLHVAQAIEKYVGEVKNVDRTVTLLGQDVNTLSSVLNSVHNALKRNEASLSAKLTDEANLFMSLHASIKDCGNTVEQIQSIFTGSQTHGRVGQAMGRVATHWKVKDKIKDVAPLRRRVVFFHNTMSMNLQMIHICLSLQAQEGHEARQQDVLNGLDQLRGQIAALTKQAQLQKEDESRSLPTTVLSSLNVAVALDGNASTTTRGTQSRIPSNSTQNSSDEAKRRVQTADTAKKCLSSKDILERDPRHSSTTQVSRDHRRPSPSYPSGRAAGDTGLSPSQQQYKRDLQASRGLLDRESIEPAKSLCRKVIHATDLNTGVSNVIHKEAIELLAHIYEHTGDRKEAARLRLLLNMSGLNTIRSEFQSLIQKSNWQRCIDYVLHWTLLLHDNSRLQLFKKSIEGLSINRGFHKSVLFAAVGMVGNTFLAQSLLTQGVSIHGQVHCSWSEYKTITPLGCAIRFGHRSLVQLLLDASSDGLDFMIDTQCVEHAIKCWDIEILRMVLDHMLLLQGGVRLGYGGSSQISKSKRLEMGALLWQRFEDRRRRGSQGSLQPLRQALHSAVDRQDLAMVKLLSEYGTGDNTIIKAATKARWVEGIQALATERNNVTEDDISYALGQDLSIAKYLLSLNRSVATNCISHAMIGSGIEGLKLVLRIGANVNAPTQYPLHLAVRSKNSQMIQTLLNAGADVHRKDGEGQTALQYAIKIGKNSHDDKVAFQATLDNISLLRKSGATASGSGGSSLGWGMSSKSRQLSAALRV